MPIRLFAALTVLILIGGCVRLPAIPWDLVDDESDFGVYAVSVTRVPGTISYWSYSDTRPRNGQSYRRYSYQEIEAVVFQHSNWSFLAAIPAEYDSQSREEYLDRSRVYVDHAKYILESINIEIANRTLPRLEMTYVFIPTDAQYQQSSRAVSRETVPLKFYFRLPPRRSETSPADLSKYLLIAFHEYYHALAKSRPEYRHPDETSEEAAAYIFSYCTIGSASDLITALSFDFDPEKGQLVESSYDYAAVMSNYEGSATLAGEWIGAATVVNAVGTSTIELNGSSGELFRQFCRNATYMQFDFRHGSFPPVSSIEGAL